MERLIEIKQTELNPTLRALSDAGVTVEDASWIRQGTNASLVEDFIRRARNRNPFEQTVEETIAALRAQNEASRTSALGYWGLTEEDYARLAETAPAWPKGKDAYRSLRIRWGEGDEGVALTFERHAEAMKRVHDPKFWRWDLLLSGTHPYQGEPVERLRLLGNQSHKPVVEWIVVIDLSANRKRKDITSVRGPQSLADEGLVLAWMFPKRAQAIDYKEWYAWYCGGYEVNVPEHDDGGWQSVVVVDRDTGSGKVRVSAGWRSYDRPDCSVPPLG